MTVLICYHKNADVIYPKKWVDEYRESILNQTYKDFIIYELCYGEDGYRIFDNSEYENIIMPSFVHAMNFLIEKALKNGAIAVANSNIDDWYDKKRLEVQLPFIEQGFDIISSNFALIKNDKEILRHQFHELDIYGELKRDNNIIAHPSVVYSKRFWNYHRYLPNQIPREDMLLWKRAIAGGTRIKIVKECLLYHRVHENSVCNSTNR